MFHYEEHISFRGLDLMVVNRCLFLNGSSFYLCTLRRSRGISKCNNIPNSTSSFHGQNGPPAIEFYCVIFCEMFTIFCSCFLFLFCPSPFSIPICACLLMSACSSFLCLGWAATCDCATPWTFLLSYVHSVYRNSR